MISVELRGKIVGFNDSLSGILRPMSGATSQLLFQRKIVSIPYKYIIRLYIFLEIESCLRREPVIHAAPPLDAPDNAE